MRKLLALLAALIPLAAGAAETDPTCTPSGGSAGNRVQGISLKVSGNDTNIATVKFDSTTSSNATSDATIEGNGSTGTANGAALIVWMHNGSSTGQTALSGYTAPSPNNSSSPAGSLGYQYKYGSAGADNTAITVSGGGNASSARIDVTIKPATSISGLSAGTYCGADNAACTAALPASYATNDLLLEVCSFGSAGTISTPSGWTSLASSTNSGRKIYLFGKIATSGTEVAPTFSSGPTTSAVDSDTVRWTFTSSTSATFKGVLCPKDATAPSVAETKALTCAGGATALGTVSKAVTGADTADADISGGRPVADAYSVLTNGAGDTTLQISADVCLSAPAGKTIINCPSGLTSIHANSPINDFNASVTPDIVAGDIMVADSATDLGDALTWTATGLYSYDGNSARRKFSANFYDLSAGANHADTMQVCVNNAAPVASVAYYDAVLVKDHPFTAIDFCAMFSDADDATLTCTSDETGTGAGAGTRPTGTTMTAGVFDDTGSGATSADGSTGSLNITATDSCGDTATIPFNWSVYSQVTVPDCVAGSLSACMAALSAINLDTSFESQCSATVAALNVISQTPAASTVVDPFSGVQLIVSSGACNGISPLPTEFLPAGTPVPASAVYRDGAAYSMTGAEYVALLPGDGVTVSHRGLKFRPDGALVINVGGTIRVYTRGIGQTNAGEVVAATCSPDYVVAGVPMDPDGTVCMTDIN